MFNTIKDFFGMSKPKGLYIPKNTPVTVVPYNPNSPIEKYLASRES